jgi:hypothetical protein
VTHIVLILFFNGIFFSETAEQKSAKLARNVHWMVLYQICVFGADLKSNMAARVHNVFSLAESVLWFQKKR